MGTGKPTKKYEEAWPNKAKYPQIFQKIKENQKNEYNKIKDFWEKNLGISYKIHPGEQLFTLSYGLYGAVFLNPDKHYPEQLSCFSAVRYNPLLDKGKGNKVWLESITKNKCNWDTQARELIWDAPLWLALYGYVDWCTKRYPHDNIAQNYRVGVISPYTVPQLYNSNQPKEGWVILSENFMRGRMPGGQGYVPLDIRYKWYPIVKQQEEMIEEIVASGPFIPRDHEYLSWDVSVGYKFNFKLGGQLLYPKQIDDPCKQPTHDLPAPGGGQFLRAVQVADPGTIGATYQFHPWDVRRGLFSEKSLRRVQKDESDGEDYEPPTKLPKTDPPTADRGLDALCDSALRGLLQEQAESEESPASSEEEATTAALQQQLRRQLQRQREQQQQLRVGFKGLVTELFKTQRGVAIDPYLR